MARRGVSELQRQERARVAAIRTISRGGRPLYRVRTAQDGSWAVEWCPWLFSAAGDSPSAHLSTPALTDAREAVAGWLEVAWDAFDVERS